MTALVLCLVLASAHASATVRVTDGREYTIRASATYETRSVRVQVVSRALYSRPLPMMPVRLAATCVGRSQVGGWADFRDGYIVNGVRRGIRCYGIAEPLALVNGRMYVVSGVCPQAGRIVVDDIAEIERR